MIGSVLCQAQLDSIFDQGTYRTFILHLPAGYNPDQSYPIVINMHGLNSNATEQQIYSQFDQIADAEKFIVAYPNAINASWSLFDDLDVNFISHFIDTLRSRYSCNDCLFFTGMSDGGFMSYKLACDLPRPIQAIASVTGNMTIFLQNACDGPQGIPLMDFHGTADNVVPYNGIFGIPPIENTVQFWVDKNDCDPVADTLELPDTHPEDVCTATRISYTGGINNSSVIFYKINNGGHTWPGTFPVASLGNTNQDISASQLIGAFFKSYCDGTTATSDPEGVTEIELYPNPASAYFNVVLPGQKFTVSVFNAMGERLMIFENIADRLEIQSNAFPAGVFFLQVETESHQVATRKLIILH